MLLRAVLVLVVLAGAARADRPITIDVDAREMPRRLLKGHLTIPAQPGKLLLRYPKWIPGEHGPSGPFDRVAKMVFTAGGKTLTWTRDPAEMFAIQVDVPAGATSIAADLEFVLPESGAFSGGATATEELGVMSWNHVVLYPDGKTTDQLQYKPSVTLPKGWKLATALTGAKTSGDRTEFAAVSLTTLVDSPVMAGTHMRVLDLGGSPKVSLALAADSEEALAVPDTILASYKRLVAEATALFGAHHYRSYTFLLTLSDRVAHFGLEHHESSDDRVPERVFLEDEMKSAPGLLLAHEYVHSWNGKYRRPAGLQPGRFDVPMNGELLWVYEGLTEYLGQVLAARAGIDTPENMRTWFALQAARVETNVGRTWRPLVDTAVAAQALYGDPTGWPSRARSVDYYPEGQQFWLEVDATIRAKTKGAKSLDDFCVAFFGGKDGAAEVVSYTLDDVVAALDKVVANDWRGLIKTRVYSLRPKAPVEGLEAAGWNLVYQPKLTATQKGNEKTWGFASEAWSVGLGLDDGNGVTDVVPGSGADKAGIAPAMKIIAVNGRAYSLDRLRAAIAASNKQPNIELILTHGDAYLTAKLLVKSGARYPDLAKGKTTDYLTPILSAKSKP